MKKILRKISSLVVSCLLIFSFCQPVIKAEATWHSVAGAVAWMDAQVGKYIDQDGAYGTQCVDLIRAYYVYLGEKPVRGNGADYATNPLPAGWTRIQGAAPEPGDIIVYTGDEYGHVELFGFDNYIYSQYPGTNVQKYQSYSGLHGWGVIRPNFASATTPSTNAGSGNMYRLYNPNSGEHFYTAKEAERDNVIASGWRYEGIGWTAPETGDPVFRLYNRNGGEHHYTMNYAEVMMLADAGWDYEGIGWYSDPAKTVPIYREYNPNAFSCNHNYTREKAENDYLVKLGWHYEGIGWYGIQ